jgi:uncharacterized protein YqhQ
MIHLFFSKINKWNSHTTKKKYHNKVKTHTIKTQKYSNLFSRTGTILIFFYFVSLAFVFAISVAKVLSIHKKI